MFKEQNSAIIIPLIVACAMFMEHLDSSILSTALPVMATSLKVDPPHLSLAITSYLLGLAAFIPLSGWLADKYGTRTVFRSAILLFTLSSAACGCSTSLGQLVLARLVQGISGAMMVPVGRLAIFRAVPKEGWINSLAWLTIPALCAPIVGPLVGGLIVTYFSWHWIFFINLPIGLWGVYLVSKYIPELKEPNIPPFDLSGFILLAIALSGLVFGFETMGRHLISNKLAVGLFVTGLVFGGFYFVHNLRTRAPILDLNLFKIPSFCVSVGGGTFFRIAIGALPFLFPLMLQIGFGLSPLASGFLTFSGAVGTVVMKFVAGKILQRYGFRRVLIVNTLISTFSVVICALFTQETSHLVIFSIFLVGGFFRSLQFTAINALAFADISQEAMSRATTLSSMMQQLSFSIGVGVAAMTLNLTLWAQSKTQLGSEDFWPAILVVSLLMVAANLFHIWLPEGAGHLVSGHRADKNAPTED